MLGYIFGWIWRIVLIYSVWRFLMYTLHRAEASGKSQRPDPARYNPRPAAH